MNYPGRSEGGAQYERREPLREPRGDREPRRGDALERFDRLDGRTARTKSLYLRRTRTRRRAGRKNTDADLTWPERLPGNLSSTAAASRDESEMPSFFIPRLNLERATCDTLENDERR